KFWHPGLCLKVSLLRSAKLQAAGGGDTMMNRLIGIAVFWLLVLATAFVAEPYMVAWWFSAASPRTITPRADLTEMERTTIKLFQSVSPSVVYVFARTTPQEIFSEGQEVSEVQTGTGIV